MKRWKFWLPFAVAVGLGAVTGPILRLALPDLPADEVVGLSFLIGMVIGALGIVVGALWSDWLPGD